MYEQHTHTHGILLCDFRPENILIDEFGILKVADFGNARKIPKQLLNDTAIEVRKVQLACLLKSGCEL